MRKALFFSLCVALLFFTAPAFWSRLNLPVSGKGSPISSAFQAFASEQTDNPGSGPGSDSGSGADEGLKVLVFYTSSAVTTPQLPLLQLEKEGFFTRTGYCLEKREWKNLDDLRGVILAGKGDIWVGHIEGLAQAFKQGAPLQLVSITGWRKFYFLSADPNVHNTASLFASLQESKAPLSVAPADGPSVGVLRKLLEGGGKRSPIKLQLAGKPSQQLSLELLRGQVDCALLPEPLVSAALAKNSRLRIVGSLEEEYAKLFGGPARLPMVGIAVQRALAEQDQDMVRNMSISMKNFSMLLKQDVLSTFDLLPEAMRKNMGAEVLRQSLQREMLLAEPAWEVDTEIAHFLDMVAPEIFGPGNPLPPDFIFKP